MVLALPFKDLANTLLSEKCFIYFSLLKGHVLYIYETYQCDLCVQIIILLEDIVMALQEQLKHLPSNNRLIIFLAGQGVCSRHI